MKIFIKIFGGLVVVIVVFFIALQILYRPSHERDWTLDQAVLPHVEIEGDIYKIFNIRNFSYRSTTDYDPAYYDAMFDITNLKKIYYIVEPFSGYVGAAHTFLSFEFEDGRFLALSVEIRKEKGESFSAVKGILRQYELMYVLADERDVVKLRSNYRKDNVYVYPVKTSIENAQATFRSVVARVNTLYAQPEIYNTITNNCTTNITNHVNGIAPGRIPWNKVLIFPENSDQYAFELGLIDTNLTSFEEVRDNFLINNLAEQYADDPEFSLRIRKR